MRIIARSVARSTGPGGDSVTATSRGSSASRRSAVSCAGAGESVSVRFTRPRDADRDHERDRADGGDRSGVADDVAKGGQRGQRT